MLQIIAFIASITYLLVVLYFFFKARLEVSDKCVIKAQRIKGVKLLNVDGTYHIAFLIVQYVHYKYLPFINKIRSRVMSQQILPYSHKLQTVIDEGNISITANNKWYYDTKRISAQIDKIIQSLSGQCIDSPCSFKDMPLVFIQRFNMVSDGMWHVDVAAYIYSHIYMMRKTNYVPRPVMPIVTSFNEYQSQALEFGIYKDKIDMQNNGNEVTWAYPILGLCGEAGEVADKLKKILRDKGGIISDDDKIAIQLELGDVLWYVSELCTRLDLSLEETAKANIAKLTSRMKRDVIKGSGDNR